MFAAWLHGGELIGGEQKYLLHFGPTTSAPDRAPDRRNSVITFDRWFVATHSKLHKRICAGQA
jgi:hypothetical protein